MGFFRFFFRILRILWNMCMHIFTALVWNFEEMIVTWMLFQLSQSIDFDWKATVKALWDSSRFPLVKLYRSVRIQDFSSSWCIYDGSCNLLVLNGAIDWVVNFDCSHRNSTYIAFSLTNQIIGFLLRLLWHQFLMLHRSINRSLIFAVQS